MILSREWPSIQRNPHRWGGQPNENGNRFLGPGVIVGVRCSAGHEFENGQTGARDLLPLGFDDLIDCGYATATGLSGRAGANDLAAIVRAVANRVADRAIGDSVALADDHRLRPVFEENTGFLWRPLDTSIIPL